MMKVEKVVDGDTIHGYMIKNKKQVKVRLRGIQAPEINYDNLIKSDYWSIKSKDALADLVAGKVVRVKLDRDDNKLDRYGRYLGFVSVNGINVQKSMLRNGNAVVYAFYTNMNDLDDFIDIEKKARNSRVGMWKDIPLRNFDAVLNRDEIKNWRSVKGFVRSIKMLSNGMNLHFGTNYAKDTTVFIPMELAKRFSAHEFKGKYIEISGWWRDKGGPFLNIYSMRQFDKY